MILNASLQHDAKHKSKLVILIMTRDFSKMGLDKAKLHFTRNNGIR